MSSAERLLPQSEVIEPLSKTSVLIPHPGNLNDQALLGILAESIFLTSKPVRIRSTYNDYVDEISPKLISKVRTEYDTFDTVTFLFDKVDQLSWADEVVIETFDK